MWWLIGAIWFIGVLWSIPLRLRARMLGWVCPESKQRPQSSEIQWIDGVGNRCMNHRRALVRRGAVRDRTGADVAIAAARTLYWPAQLIVWLCTRSMQKTGHGFAWFVDRITPLTEPERERRNRELEARLTAQQREIEQLSAKL